MVPDSPAGRSEKRPLGEAGSTAGYPPHRRKRPGCHEHGPGPLPRLDGPLSPRRGNGHRDQPAQRGEEDMGNEPVVELTTRSRRAGRRRPVRRRRRLARLRRPRPRPASSTSYSPASPSSRVAPPASTAVGPAALSSGPHRQLHLQVGGRALSTAGASARRQAGPAAAGQHLARRCRQTVHRRDEPGAASGGT
jgi:hypothetical protein